MKNHFFLKTLMMLGLFGSYLDDPNAGGGDGEFDPEIDDPEPEPNPPANDPAGNPPPANDPTPPAEDETVSKKDFDELQEYVQNEQREKANNKAFDEIKETHPDFDAKKVTEYLQELYKTDPDKATALNNPIGFENVYLKEFQVKPVDNDHPSLGRNVTAVNRSEEFETKLENGDILSIDEQMKYFG